MLSSVDSATSVTLFYILGGLTAIVLILAFVANKKL